MESHAESDEMLAQRLQAQEMGGYGGNITVNAQTPLVNRENGNPAMVNARNDAAARGSVYLLFVIYGPQVLASFIVLGMHWNDPDVCDATHTRRWKLWSFFAACRMFAFIGLGCYVERYRSWLIEHVEASNRVRNMRNLLEGCGFLWFIVGNMWLFGDDDHICHHAGRSPIYNLSLSLIILQYVQMCFPCIVAILLLPVFCFCMPCVIRILARLQDPRASVGATDAVIETLPEVIIDASHIPPGQDNTCPICLSDLVIGDSARVLSCTHIFHKQCVDEWLRVNASCPTCRKRIIEGPEPVTSNNPTATTNPINTTNTTANTVTIENHENQTPNPVANTPARSALQSFVSVLRRATQPRGPRYAQAGDVPLLPYTNRNRGHDGYSLVPNTSSYNISAQGGDSLVDEAASEEHKSPV